MNSIPSEKRLAMDTVYIVLFRGVGGATQLPTKPLREALSAAGFDKVATYINSGNAIVSTALGTAQAKASIAAIVKRDFAFDKDIMLVSQAAWARLVKDNPFPDAADRPTTLHAFVLNRVPDEAAIAALASRAAVHENVAVIGNVLYFHAPLGFGTSKLPPVIDRVLGVVSTARNWNSVVRLMELADSAAGDQPAGT